ncbi:thioredoxin family protein [Bacillus sp. FSL K6-0067]|uniref:thioredoxin family protein n=1 Tax=Bacillus sp. FSL K6-0067 TaxID=2921412 RepID=UPI00077A3DD0|nr:thioredoxin family protein [Bacillus cereus]KXY23347.1 hypothetical protein AT267_27695 [Bacillus cereus]
MKKFILLLIILLFLGIGVHSIIHMKQQKSEKLKITFQNHSISINRLKQFLNDKTEILVYFYQTDCSHYHTASSILTPLVKEMNIDMQMVNLQKEPESVWNEFHISGTPTLVYFKQGKEINRVEGLRTKPYYQQWFIDHKIKH